MKVIFRADGGAQVGLGHIMRSVALMQILQGNFDCEFWTNTLEYFPFGEFSKFPTVRKLSIEDKTAEALELVKQAPSHSTVVLDGYAFDTNYQSILKEAGLKVVCIDDLMCGHFVADAVINHAGNIDKERYSREGYTQLYTGPQYALIKPAFFFDERPARNIESKKLLISLGAADPENCTDKVLDKLLSLSFFEEIDVVVGSANPHMDLLKKKYSAEKKVSFFYNLSVDEMIMAMRHCTYAVLTPSTVCYEYMSIGGVVLLYQIADNQSRNKEYFIREKLAFTFDDISHLSVSDCQNSLHQQANVFDGKSSERLLQIFNSLYQ